MLDTMCVKIVNNKVVESECAADRIAKQNKPSYLKTNDRKSQHLIDIGMDLSKYHPKVITSLIGGGRSILPEALRAQVLSFALEAIGKHFVPSIFGYNTKLHTIIKTLQDNTRPYNKKKTDISGDQLKSVLNDIEDCLKEGELSEAEEILDKNKSSMPLKVYTKMKQIIS